MNPFQPILQVNATTPDHNTQRRQVVKAEFGGSVVAAKRPGEQVVRVAESATVVKKAVSDFEAEVRGMRDRLYTLEDNKFPRVKL